VTQLQQFYAKTGSSDLLLSGTRQFANGNAAESAIDCLHRVLTQPSAAQYFLELPLPYYVGIREESGFIELQAGFDD
jgi:hypothetical protein